MVGIQPQTRIKQYLSVCNKRNGLSACIHSIFQEYREKENLRSTG
jgi:hypothetical protein